MYFRDQTKAEVRIRISERIIVDGIDIPAGDYDGFERPDYTYFMRNYVLVGKKTSVLMGEPNSKELGISQHLSSGVATIV
ncbi:hypothetical protein OIV19_20750 [Brucella sp. HL-2]|nr:hypothetical protein [Brucella sp. HL-2]MCV9910033.1 hypothetical protein [Brucella sp. HL-2]